jgi:serine/threonine protein kinase
MTPEMIVKENSSANPAMDVWTIGILVYEMLFNKKPFDG